MKKTLTCLAIMMSALIFGTSDVNAVQMKTEDIENSTYIIGTHMFTREGSEYYNGVLTTDYIMLASQTINSNKLEDMIIYYKNPRGKWLDVLKNEVIEVEDTIEITHKNNKLYVETPVLSNPYANDTSRPGPDSFDYVGFENGMYIFDLAINFIDYEIQDGVFSADGYDVFEKDGNEYTYIVSGTMGGAAVVEVEAGTKKTFVAKAYVLNGENEKVYSEYSNELIIDKTTYETPELINAYASRPITYVGFENGSYIYDLAIDFQKYEISDNYYTVEGYDVFEKNGSKYTYVASGTMGGAAVAEVEAGTKKTLVARTYVRNSKNEKVYSDISNELVLDNTKIETPTLTVGHASEDTLLYLGFTIYTEGYYTTDIAQIGISGWELYEKVGNSYNLLEEKDVEIYAGETKTYVARAYALNKSGEKIYSDYSNGITESKTVKAPTLTSAHGSEGYVGFTIFMEGHYSITGKDNTIDGWELYEKVGEEYIYIEGDGGFVDRGEIKTYVARAYALNRDGQKVYSDYSNEYVADCTVVTPTLTAGHGSEGFVGFTIYTEGHYADELNAQTIEGWELYEKIGNNYNLVEGNEVELNEGETRTFVARAYAYNQSNEKIYSDYSNEVVVDNSN